MLIKVSDLVSRLYSCDEVCIIDALRVLRAQDSTSMSYVIDAILRPDENLGRPVFYNPHKEFSVITMDEPQLKVIAVHIKQRSDLKNTFQLLNKLSDVQMLKLARFIRDEKESIFRAESVDKPLSKPFVPAAISWRSQRDSLLGTTR